MGAWGVAGLLGVWLASATAGDAQPRARPENGPGRRHMTAPAGVRRGERRRPPATSRRRTRKTVRAAERQTEGTTRPGQPLGRLPAEGEARTPPASTERPAASGSIPPGVLQAGPRVESAPAVRGGASTSPADMARTAAARVQRPPTIEAGNT